MENLIPELSGEQARIPDLEPPTEEEIKRQEEEKEEKEEKEDHEAKHDADELGTHTPRSAAALPFRDLATLYVRHHGYELNLAVIGTPAWKEYIVDSAFDPRYAPEYHRIMHLLLGPKPMYSLLIHLMDNRQAYGFLSALARVDLRQALPRSQPQPRPQPQNQPRPKAKPKKENRPRGRRVNNEYPPIALLADEQDYYQMGTLTNRMLELQLPMPTDVGGRRSNGKVRAFRDANL